MTRIQNIPPVPPHISSISFINPIGNLTETSAVSSLYYFEAITSLYLPMQTPHIYYTIICFYCITNTHQSQSDLTFSHKCTIKQYCFCAIFFVCASYTPQKLVFLFSIFTLLRNYSGKRCIYLDKLGKTTEYQF